jgi:ABC-type dipeptide/oligopeptide/nickel transport system permease subunit
MRGARQILSTPSERAGLLGQTWHRLRLNHGAMVGLALLLVLLFIAIAGPYMAPHDPSIIDPDAVLKAPDRERLLGADQFGRDILSRVLHGARLSLQLGLTTVGIAATIGTVVGVFSGYRGGWNDFIIQRATDLLLIFPSLLLALFVVAVMGPSMQNLMLAIAIAFIPVYIRLVRGSVLSAKENMYVEAARATGCTDLRIMRHHILPNVIAPIIVLATLGVGEAIVVAASLGFLGLGAQPPTPEWGAIAADGRKFLRQAWWITTFPGLSIMVTVLALNIVGDALRDALDPVIRRRM